MLTEYNKEHLKQTLSFMVVDYPNNMLLAHTQR